MKALRALLMIAMTVLAACAASPAGVVPQLPRPTATSTASTPASAASSPARFTQNPLAETYLRALDGIEYTSMSPAVEQQLTPLFADLPDGFAVRDVSVRGSTSRLRLVVLHVAAQYAGQKILDDQTGFGGRTALPARLTIGGLPAFYHSDVAPNFLVWQQAQFLVLIYGADRPSMETLASRLIAANK